MPRQLHRHALRDAGADEIADSGSPKVVTADGRFSQPVLTPSGDRLALMERGRGIVTMPIGGGPTEVMVEGPTSKWPTGWSRAFRRISGAGW